MMSSVDSAMLSPRGFFDEEALFDERFPERAHTPPMAISISGTPPDAPNIDVQRPRCANSTGATLSSPLSFSSEGVSLGALWRTPLDEILPPPWPQA